DLGDITLAYAMSVHKAQGSEYPYVYFIFDQSQSHMLYKKLIYTAISRARNKLVLIGDKDLFLASANKKLPKRKTSLIMRLKSML
ncbi:MAG: ATP-binding domain-containing protein, partial [Erysipelotrichaceae bacterium]|nr:ATP-binding domain-containing protein [Erysipelotrichaceae bacterium]